MRSMMGATDPKPTMSGEVGMSNGVVSALAAKGGAIEPQIDAKETENGIYIYDFKFTRMYTFQHFPDEFKDTLCSRVLGKLPILTPRHSHFPSLPIRHIWDNIKK